MLWEAEELGLHVGRLPLLHNHDPSCIHLHMASEELGLRVGRLPLLMGLKCDEMGVL